MSDCLRILGLSVLAVRRAATALWDAFINFRPVDWRPVAEIADRIARKADPSRCILTLLAVLLAGLAGLFLRAGFSEGESWIFKFLGVGPEKKTEALTFLGLAMGGVLLTIQAVVAHRRAKAMEDSAKEQAKANKNSEMGLQQERLKNAIEHLGDNRESVRLGGTYELFHLARDDQKDDKEDRGLRQIVLDILCAHIRQTTGQQAYREAYKEEPSEEVQNLLTLLFFTRHDVFDGFAINLEGSWLNGASFPGAWPFVSGVRLKRANMRGVYLRGAILRSAQLQEANLYGAQLEGADLRSADLLRTILCDAHLQGANLDDADLERADLRRAHLRGASLCDVDMKTTDLRDAHLQGANLDDADLRLAKMHGAQMQGTDFATHIWLERALMVRSCKGQICTVHDCKA